MDLKIKRLHPDAKIPVYATPGARGADIYALTGGHLWPNDRGACETGFALEVPDGYGVMILPRSGLGAKHGVSVINSPGLIDSDYRGQVMVLMENRGPAEFTWRPGERIAQMVLVELPQARFIEVAELKDTERGTKGLGSTGV